jgi:AraC family transcriptional regulator
MNSEIKLDMNIEINELPLRNVVGVHVRMSHQENRTSELWRSLMPRRNEIVNATSKDLLSITRYDSVPDFRKFNPAAEFEKWAGVEVSAIDSYPDGMNAMVMPGGLYAVFKYKGLSTDPAPYQYIFGTWLPASEFVLDHREHFEILGANYRNNDPLSEEEICIPVRRKF